MAIKYPLLCKPKNLATQHLSNAAPQNKMNYIKHLTAYFHRASDDPELNPTHISLYMALFQFWNLNRFRNPISITREEAMQISKIGSKSTYHKCMYELHKGGYIIYKPSYNPLKGSIVHMIDFESLPKASEAKTSTISEQVVGQLQDKLRTACETSIGQVLVPSMNNRNRINFNQKNDNSESKKRLNHLHTLTQKNYEEPL